MVLFVPTLFSCEQKQIPLCDAGEVSKSYFAKVTLRNG